MYWTSLKFILVEDVSSIANQKLHQIILIFVSNKIILISVYQLNIFQK